VVSASGVAYADPVREALARDQDGVLWALGGGSTTGRPEYGAEFHPERQRTAMDGLLCACCKEPTARCERGMLWVLPPSTTTCRRAWRAALRDPAHV
jgi:hypothetical protein